MKKKILLGLTTTPKSDWHQKVEEIKKYKIKEVALFPTFLGIKDRKKLYNLLEKSGIETIPHVHLRDDMESWELDYFYKNYKTELFNVHARVSDSDLVKNNLKYRKNIYIENGSKITDYLIDMAKNCGGFCFDTSHYHDFAILQKDDHYKVFLELSNKIPIGCCHISAIAKKYKFLESLLTGNLVKSYSRHYLKNLEELDYVKNYVDYLPEIVSIELENSFKEQLAVKKYLEKIVN